MLMFLFSDVKIVPVLKFDVGFLLKVTNIGDNKLSTDRIMHYLLVKV